MESVKARTIKRVVTSVSLVCFSLDVHVQAFAVRGICPHTAQRSPRVPSFHPTSRLRMTIEPIVTLIIAADEVSSLSEFGSVSDLAGPAVDLAGSAQASVGESLGSIGDTWSSIADSVASVKEQATETAMGSVTALKTQMGDIGSSVMSPFQELGEYLSASVTGGLDSLESGAQGAMEGAQTQLGQSVTENIGNPLEEGLRSLFSQFGTSPEAFLKEEESFTMRVQETIQGLEKVATPSTLFYLENIAILPFWAGMIIWPDKSLTKAVMSSYAPVIVAAVVYLWLTYESFQNPVALQGFASGITNLDGLTKGFGEEVSVATAWSHFLAEDLFIGRWVYLDGQRNGVFNKHSLVLCYLFGPAGFLSHLFTRTAFSIVKPSVRDIEEFGASGQPKVASRAPAIAKPTPSVGDETKTIISEARQEAEVIIKQARTEGAIQAASLLKAAETEALDILKGAEVERSALLKTSKSETSTSPVGDDVKTVLQAETINPAQEMKATSPEPEESSNKNGPAKVAVSREESSNP